MLGYTRSNKILASRSTSRGNTFSTNVSRILKLKRISDAEGLKTKSVEDKISRIENEDLVD